MKKTLIALLALAGTVYADVDLSNPFLDRTLVTSSMSSVSLDNYDSADITVAITLDVNFLKTIMRGESTGVAKQKQLVSLWGNNMGSSAISLGTNNESESNLITTGGIFLGANTAADSTTQKAGTSLGDLSTDVSDVAWNNANWAVVTWAYDHTGLQNVYLTYEIGKTTTTISGSATSARNNTNITGIYFNSNIVTGVMAYEGLATSSQVESIAKAIIPEPTTATLSLLALAGLAARRRRK